MHRGYWARVHVVRRLVENFVASSHSKSLNISEERVQIVSLGCGLETLWFNLMEEESYRERDVKFVELDLDTVTKKKIKKIEKSKLITNLLTKNNLAESKKISCIYC